ncbi:MAG: class I SAM-dependent methyltransferase [Bacteroidales bacterium]|nr:class I SAM-dependent methyltransferase [Bacteroidales bacterium]
MKIIHPQILKDIENGKPLKLDLGSGGNVKDNFYSIDIAEMKGIDIIADLNESLNLIPDNSVEHIYSRHLMEHIKEFLPLLKEIYRITKPGGKIEIIVPHFSNVLGFSDPTHCRFFGLYTMYYFVNENNQPATRKFPSHYSEAKFIIDTIKIEFYRKKLIDRIIGSVLMKIINKNIKRQEFYERRISGIYHAWQIKYIMFPDK